MNIKSVIIILIISIFVSCSDSKTKKAENNTWKHKVLVEEVIQTGSYTYLLVSEDGETQWIAVSKMNAKPKDILYYNSGLEMKGFNSNELQRTFDNLLLVQVISVDESGISRKVVPKSLKKKMEQSKSNIVNTGSDKNIDLVTISELFTNSSKYNGKRITISGNVVKVNPNIMGRNWVHLRDGENNYDLTVTTNELVNVGSYETFIGDITLNKDFGSGYKFSIIMENAILK